MIQLRRGIIAGFRGIVGVSLIVLIVQTLAYLDFRTEFQFPPYDEVEVVLMQMGTGAEIKVSDEEEKNQILDSMRSIQYAGIRSRHAAYSKHDGPYSIFVTSKNYNNIFVIAENSSVNFFDAGRFAIKLKNCEDTLMTVRKLFEKY